jgi:hypothetical protein
MIFPCLYLGADVPSRPGKADLRVRGEWMEMPVDITEEVKSLPKGCLLNPID